MAYLNFRDPFRKPGDETPIPSSVPNQVTVELLEHPRLKWLARFKIPSETRAKISEALLELSNSASPNSSEIRMDFPQGWTLFLKLRDSSESRLLLAHPEKEEWVATFALSREHLDAVSVQFQNAEGFQLSQIGRVEKMSNVEFEALFA